MAQGSSNPLISSGTLNLTQASVSVLLFPQLNVTASFLGKGGIRLALEGETTRRIGTMTGVTTSPQVYQDCRVTINLLKTQLLSDLYKQQMETLSVIGNITVRPDVSVGTGLSPYPLTNCSIQSVREQDYSGDDAGFAVELMAVYTINATLWAG
jgi:hypothetical protein